MLLLAALIVAVRLPFLRAGQMDWDEGVYWESLRALAAGHPLFATVYSSQPPAFLLLLEPWYRLLGGGIAAARAATLLYSLLGFLGAYLAAERLAGRGSGIVALAALAIPSFLVRETVQLLAEGPALGLALLALGVAALAPRDGSRSALVWLAGAGVIAATAVLVKLLALPVLPALAAVALQDRPRLARSAALATGAVLGAAAWLLPFAGLLPQLYAQVVGLHLAARAIATGDAAGVASTLLGLAPLFVAAAAGLLIAYRSGGRLFAPVLAWLAGAGLLLAVQHPLWPHHLAAVAVPAALAAAPLARLLPARLRPPVFAAAVLAVVAGSAVFALSIPDDRAQRLAAAELAQRVSAGRRVITDDQYTVALAGRDVPPGLVDTSQVRIVSGSLSGAELLAAADDPENAGILEATGRLRLLPALPQAEARFPRHEELAGGRELLLR